MNKLINDFQNHSIEKSDDDVDRLCNQMINSGIEYDERKELYEFLELKKAGIKVLRQTDERYTRYLNGIDIWEIDGVSYEYIRENIKKYLNFETNNFEPKEEHNDLVPGRFLEDRESILSSFNLWFS